MERKKYAQKVILTIHDKWIFTAEYFHQIKSKTRKCSTNKPFQTLVISRSLPSRFGILIVTHTHISSAVNTQNNEAGFIRYSVCFFF